MMPRSTPTPAAPATPEQLALAFRQVRRPGWPSTLEEALQRPAYALAIQGIARCMGRAKPTAAARPIGIRTALVPPTPCAHTPPARPSRQAGNAAAARCGKLAAANDLED